MEMQRLLKKEQHKSQYGCFAAAPFYKRLSVFCMICLLYDLANSNQTIIKHLFLWSFLTKHCFVHSIRRMDSMIVMRRSTNKDYKESSLCKMTIQWSYPVFKEDFISKSCNFICNAESVFYMLHLVCLNGVVSSYIWENLCTWL